MQTNAHHNVQAEFGSFDSPTANVQGIVVDIFWGNPHVYFTFEVTGGEIDTGEIWKLESHPVDTMFAYGFARSDFAIGDTVSIIGWKSRRGARKILPRAIQVNEGVMRSSLLYRDMIDIANGALDERNIAPAQNLDGAPPEKAGADVIEKLQQLGMLDENGLLIWPSNRTDY